MVPVGYPPSMPSIGESLAGRYRLDAVIGSGGFATVFRAHDLLLDRDVAVKVLLTDETTDPVVAARFDQEARVLAAVSHPNVVAIHDVAPGGPGATQASFLVMDLCEGGSLADRLSDSTGGALHPDEFVPILEDAAAGIAALHAIGIVHRDLKPSNILLAHGRALIADLGIAAAGPSELTAVGTTIGTFAYLAPEQLAGMPASPASDVHALGIVAFLGLTGALPRPARSVTEAVAASRLPARVVSALQPGLGPAFDAVIAGALDADPSRRPTAADFGASLAVALERWRGTPGSVAPRWGAPVSVAPEDATTVVDLALPRHDGPTVESTTPLHREARLVVLVGVLAAALLLALAATLLGRFGESGGTDAASSAAASAAASVTPPPTAGPPSPSMPTPAATPAPTVAADAYTEAHAASAGMRAAIADARGAGGLNGHKPKDLEGRLDRFDRALDKGDPKAAREEAGKVAEQVAKLIREASVDVQAAAGLQTAADRLVAAASALPD